MFSPSRKNREGKKTSALIQFDRGFFVVVYFLDVDRSSQITIQQLALLNSTAVSHVSHEYVHI